MTCRWRVVDGVRYFHPDCWGGALNGPDGCYCPRPGQPTTDDRIDKLEERLIKVEQQLARISARQS